MSTFDDDGSVRDVTTAFSVLGNETRMDVLRALWEADGPVSYADLRRAVVPDDRGNLHYHLDKLAGHYITKTDDGYALRFTGEQIVRAVVAGTFTTGTSIPPVEVDVECGYCDGQLELFYRDDRITIRCPDCIGSVGGRLPRGWFLHYGFPPAGLAGRSPESIVEAAEVLIETKLSALLNGVCSECAGTVERTIEVCEDHELEEGVCRNCETRYAAWVTLQCVQCRYERTVSAWYASLSHPAVVSFLADHGHESIQPFRIFTSGLARFKRDVEIEVLETDPYRLRVTIHVNDETLAVTVDDAFRVESVERSNSSSP